MTTTDKLNCGVFLQREYVYLCSAITRNIHRQQRFTCLLNHHDTPIHLGDNARLEPEYLPVLPSNINFPSTIVRGHTRHKPFAQNGLSVESDSNSPTDLMTFYHDFRGKKTEDIIFKHSFNMTIDQLPQLFKSDISIK